MERVIILGKNESAISMIADNMESIHDYGVFVVVNNLGLPDDLPYKNSHFDWHECNSIKDDYKNFVIGVVNPQIKEQIFNTFKIEVNSFINCIHRSSEISTTSKLGNGIIINSLVSIAAHSTIGNFVTINRNASVGHHTTIEDFVTISPSATICGKVKIGRGTFIGASAIIRDGITIGDNCVIGAGSVVVKNISSGSKGYGNPFRAIAEKIAE